MLFIAFSGAYIVIYPWVDRLGALLSDSIRRMKDVANMPVIRELCSALADKNSMIAPLVRNLVTVGVAVVVILLVFKLIMRITSAFSESRGLMLSNIAGAILGFLLSGGELTLLFIILRRIHPFFSSAAVTNVMSGTPILHYLFYENPLLRYIH